MLNDIFQIDWIFVDIIIIILLILLLVSVKIFKSTHRWRSSFSNITLDTFFVSDVQKLVGNKFILTKKVTLIRDSSLQEICNENPLILILRTHHKRKFLRILTEGLGNYGFNIISVKLKIKHYQNSIKFENIVIHELKSIISTFINLYKEKGLILNQNYILLSHSGSSFPYKAILNDIKNEGMILINPKINLKNLKYFIKVNDNKLTNDHLYTIFSKNSTFVLPNKNLKFLQANISSQKLTGLKILTLGKAKKSFKYYETIVLGMIIDIIKNKLLKLIH
ncbi:MAG: hypothetical protein KAW51_07105 [Candidatus Lokiarchaeota archaeon]|nr:hypothetical protein [Candidatus Lokiarchaeota archaeon]